MFLRLRSKQFDKRRLCALIQFVLIKKGVYVKTN